jgi:hypothetical protein
VAIPIASKRRRANGVTAPLIKRAVRADRAKDEIPVGREFIAYPLEWVHGYVKWKNGAIVAERLGKVADGFKLPQRDDLDENDKTKWKNDQDPWQQQNMWFSR